MNPDPPYGNGIAERMNDFRDDVTRPDQNDRSKINVSWAMVLKDFEPFQMFAARRTLTHSDWLLMDYGRDYWKSRSK